MNKPAYFRGKSQGATGISVGGDKGMNAFPIPIENIVQKGSPNSFSLLDFLGVDNTTYIRAIIDTSGSMDSSIPEINRSIDDLKEILLFHVWSGNQTKLNKYLQRSERNDERWIRWIAEDLRDSPSEPDKTLFLIWINEAEPSYQTTSSGDGTYIVNQDINNFINIYNNSRLFFKCLIFGLNTAGPSEAFQEHLENVRHGTNGVNTALTPSSYDVNIFKDINPDSKATFYFDAMLGKKEPI